MASQICFTLPRKILDDFKKYCEENNYNQSELIRHLIRLEIYKDGQHRFEAYKIMQKGVKKE